ncbi:Flp pilus assembly protein CpaB [Erythrobacter sp. LQ02-29]|uniref:Flp pilus assembly protein CpaB n=1 Tax=Erythrobacter sp. LQ02-29 TaxID=2920384 RepID=UPI001F4DF570|nr:Flp pilus assembly protein CpaB [Erythrobacter sp. LQ02-29]MCP9222482.1 Flp pilus assembly protein CpaB [Erythrobacter sp. LQ02-29]
MDRKKVILIVGALFVAIITALAARSMIVGSSAPEASAVPAQPAGTRVLVAQRALPAGTIITADAIGYQQWPDGLMKDAYFIDGQTDINKLLGTVVRLPITAGEPVTQGALVAPGDRGFLAAALAPGMRAVTIPVSDMTGVGGFIFPGDHVDLMLTQSIAGDDTTSGLNATETFLRNLRVLATDKKTETTKGEDGKTEVTGFTTVTLEVTPKMAEKVAVAQTIGTLSLALRSLADNQDDLERAIAEGDVKIPEDATPEEEERLLRRAASRPTDGGSSYATGGDVSRFQNRTFVRSRPASQQQQGQAQMPMNYLPMPGTAPSQPTGPIVRVTRGTDTSAVEINRNGQAKRSDTGGATTNDAQAAAMVNLLNQMSANGNRNAGNAVSNRIVQ